MAQSPPRDFSDFGVSFTDTGAILHQAGYGVAPVFPFGAGPVRSLLVLTREPLYLQCKAAPQ